MTLQNYLVADMEAGIGEVYRIKQVGLLECYVFIELSDNELNLLIDVRQWKYINLTDEVALSHEMLMKRLMGLSLIKLKRNGSTWDFVLTSISTALLMEHNLYD